ncbi:hypothetical protein B0T18DRAFT_402056 [Schizothecium vesticola]|uniref:Uncharacterized protein n=1 Tax=Schizothecium vesticola TaxID=314040 RepID=A0AA40F4Z4_9PEZI|nr:hypothetical protein B0T18DRAFT_402056 [Schizothecium vesticola]
MPSPTRQANWSHGSMRPNQPLYRAVAETHCQMKRVQPCHPSAMPLWKSGFSDVRSKTRCWPWSTDASPLARPLKLRRDAARLDSLSDNFAPEAFAGFPFSQRRTSRNPPRNRITAVIVKLCMRELACPQPATLHQDEDFSTSPPPVPKPYISSTSQKPRCPA